MSEMLRIAIVQTSRLKGSNSYSKKMAYSFCRPLPIHYVSEHSVMGLFVDDLEAALKVLDKEGLATTEEAFGAEMSISSRNELPEIVRKLSESGIYCTPGDVIDSIYQG
jgi:hypothetical protein